jgi:hypothetical protein
VRLPRLWLVASVAVAPAFALADEPRGCDKFKWPVAQDQAALNQADKARVESGGAIVLGAPVRLALAPFAQARLPMAPERAPKSASSYAGMANAPAPAAGVYKISLSEAGWIDVIQDGGFVRSTGFSGALDCPGVRRIVKFPLKAAPFVIEVSGVDASELSLIVSPE